MIWFETGVVEADPCSPAVERLIPAECVPSSPCSVSKRFTTVVFVPAGLTPNSFSMATMAEAKSLTTSALAFVFPGLTSLTSRDESVSNAPG